MIFAIIVVGTFQFHLPLYASMNELQRAFPSADSLFTSPLDDQKSAKGTSELILTDKEVVAWHEALWKYRRDIINQVQLVDMDDEEEVRFSFWYSRAKKNPDCEWEIAAFNVDSK
jgi:hypothetical protein